MHELTAKPGDYRYKLEYTGRSTHSLGNCEVCGQHADEVFHQTEEQHYEYKRYGRAGWTTYGCRSLYGHKSCLLAARKDGSNEADIDGHGRDPADAGSVEQRTGADL